MIIKMNKRQKFIASCANPYYGGFATKEEVKKAKLLARGKYWIEDLQFGCPQNEEDHNCFFAFSPTGRRYYFEFDWFSWGTKKQKARWKNEARRACRHWCKGEYKKALQIYNDSYLNSDK
jgi:hypothetical protein